MQISIEIPENYISEFNKIIKNKDIKEYLEEHIISVLEVTCPKKKFNWKSFLKWS